MFLGKGVLQIRCKVTWEQLCQSAVKYCFCKEFNKTIEIVNYEHVSLNTFYKNEES